MSGSDLALSGTDPAALAEAAAVEAGRQADLSRMVDDYLNGRGDYAPAPEPGAALEQAETELAEQQQAEADPDAMSDSQAEQVLADRLAARLGGDRGIPTLAAAAAANPTIRRLAEHWGDAGPTNFRLLQSAAARLPAAALDALDRAGVLNDAALIDAVIGVEWSKQFSAPRRGAGQRRAQRSEVATMSEHKPVSAAERAQLEARHRQAVARSDLAFASGDRAAGQRWAQIGDQLAERLWGGERIVDGVRTA